MHFNLAASRSKKETGPSFEEENTENVKLMAFVAIYTIHLKQIKFILMTESKSTTNFKVINRHI